MCRLFQFVFLGALASAQVATAQPATVRPAAGPLTRDAFVAAVAGNLVTHFNCEGEMQLELLRTWSAPDCLAAVWTVEITEFPLVLSSSLLVRCRALADNQVAGEYTLTLRAALWRDVWVARQPVPANASFDPALLEVRRVDVLRERDVLPASVRDPGFMFVRAIQPNRLLSWRDVIRRPLVRKGDFVEVAAIDGQLQVTMKGLAMENGAQGDTVIIRNPDSKKDFSALVVGENHVQVRL